MVLELVRVTYPESVAYYSIYWSLRQMLFRAVTAVALSVGEASFAVSVGEASFAV